MKEAEEKAHTIEILTNKYKEELKNLKGLFSGKRRGELESIISQKEEELKSIHQTIVQNSEELKTEESKLQDTEKINKKRSYNKIKANQVSNRLYKLHQQIQEKKEQVKKIFEKKRIG